MFRSPFKLGETIFCIRSSYDSAGPLYTEGKSYKVVVCTSKLYDNLGIKGDPIPQLPDGRHLQPSWSNFITLKESRKRKLQKICSR